MSKKWFLLVVAIAVAAPSLARAEVLRFSLVGAGAYTKVIEDGTTLDPDGIGLGGGALAEFAIGKDMGLEFGALYVTRKVKTEIRVLSKNISVNESATGLQFPVILRFWPIRFLSFGAGAYYHRYLKSTVTTSTGLNVASDLDGDDVGVIGSLMLRIPFFVGSLVLDGRFCFGVKSEQVQEAQGLAGLMFSI